MEISKEDFKAYESVRTSNATNMFMVSKVSEISGLHKDKCLEIMKNYDYLCEKYDEEIYGG
jgi:hypothetical protein